MIGESVVAATAKAPCSPFEFINQKSRATTNIMLLSQETFHVCDARKHAEI